MRGFVQAFAVELRKARRSRLPLITLLAFAIAPFAGGFFMIVLRDPEMARRAGFISAKAQIVAGSADWPAYLDFLAQAISAGGILLFSVVASWVFGREFSDRTVKDLLALPTPRSDIVLAKFAVMALWSAVLSVFITIIGFLVGMAIKLPPVPAQVMVHGSLVLAVTACLTIVVVMPIAFFASAGRGYLPPIGIAILLLVFTQIVAFAGWGDYFPWAIPALYAGLGGEQNIPGAVSFVIVALTGLAGMAVTLIWWARADQSR